MGKRCCKKCPGSSCCGCCCTKRMATITFSVIGLTLAVLVLVPPIYVYSTDQDYSKLFPWFKYSKKFLEQVTDAKFADDEQDRMIEVYDTESRDDLKGVTHHHATDGVSDFDQDETETPREKYRLALFQLLDDIESNSTPMALASFVIGCLNIPIHILLLIGACCKSPCLMLPWLAVTLLEHLIVGVPMIVFFGIISLYLAAQLNLYLVAGAVIGSIVMLFLLSLSSWFTVHACYNEFYRSQDYYYESTGNLATGNSSTEVTQPLLPSGGNASGSRSSRGPALPPGHPNGYHLGQYPQYYPPHNNQSRQLPSAPPTASSSGIYPHLPTA